MLFGKQKKDQASQYVSGIFDAFDTDVIVVRQKNCETLFANEAARRRVEAAGQTDLDCRGGYYACFSDLCDRCPVLDTEAEYPFSFDVHDKEGRLVSVNASQIQWTDDKPAVVLVLRDVDDERNVQAKLFKLAYRDQLTGVPNRQKFKEDFEAVAAKIENEEIAGIVAIFDLDNFKSINDTYGHNTGDIMLKRLTDHLEGDPAFKGHLYRLGGDEFVLFYQDAKDRFATPEQGVAHYEKLLQGAFLTYSMPNIELSCTISMGVAFYPRHGVNSSELLRKADIALYKAKAEGRNKLVLFEDQYDTAKKFKDLYIGIQPIMTQSGRTFGYELVDRGEDEQEEEALNLTDSDRALDALGLSDLTSDAHYFINYSEQLFSGSVLKHLQKDKFIVQMHLPAAVSAKELGQYKELKAHGYSLAMDGLTRANASPELLNLADFLKFAPASDPGWQKKLVEANPSKRFIATGVDSSADLADAKARGFKLFQGFFFNEPVVVQKTKDISPLKVNYFRLLQLTSADGYVNFSEISSVISSDVALSYKLLRLLNSAAVGLRNQISSIDMALAYLGEENLKQWIAMLALRGTASDKPLALVRMSLIRARFAEQLAPHYLPKRNTKHLFLIGLLSLLHIALEKDKEELLDEIPVAQDIREALLSKNGLYSDLIPFFTNYEYANWEEVGRYADEHHLNPKMVNDAYIAAVKWYNDLEDTEPVQ